MSAELAKRAVACKGWRWMPGMLSVQGVRCTEPNMLPPDLADPATQGCILTLIAAANRRASMLDALVDVAHHMRTGMLFAEALVAALEAAS